MASIVRTRSINLERISACRRMVQVPANHNDIEKRLWDAADEMRANSKLKSSEYSLPVLGLIFLKYANHVFARAAKDLEGKSTGRRTIGKID